MPQHKSTFRDPYRKTEKMNVNCLTSNPSCHMRQMWMFAFSCCFMSWNQGIRLDQRLGYTDQPMISEDFRGGLSTTWQIAITQVFEVVGTFTHPSVGSIICLLQTMRRSAVSAQGRLPKHPTTPSLQPCQGMSASRRSDWGSPKGWKSKFSWEVATEKWPSLAVSLASTARTSVFYPSLSLYPAHPNAKVVLHAYDVPTAWVSHQNDATSQRKCSLQNKTCDLICAQNLGSISSPLLPSASPLLNHLAPPSLENLHLCWRTMS